jgi:glycosyltransferase involved in cell wall biosynthesis
LRGERPTSFEYQLRLLAEFLHPYGLQAHLLGPEPHPLRDAVRSNAVAAILLGYPDQFSRLLSGNESPVPIFLWAQCSRAPDPALFGNAQVVPLTPKSEAFIRKTGYPRITAVIPHGVDTELFTPADAENRARLKGSWGVENRFIVGALGANTFRKRFDLILESFARFAASRQDASLIIRTDRLKGASGTDLPRLAERLGISGQTRFITEVYSPRRMRELYCVIDVFLNLSEWEGFCLPVAEAMACGTPVITHRIQGPGEVVPYSELVAEDSVPYEEKGSILFQADPETIARLLKRAASDPLRERLGAWGRAETARRYDIRHVAEQWEKLITTGGSCG